MTKAIDFGAFSETANRYGRIIGNDYMMPGTVKKLIEYGKLYYKAVENCLFIFEERDGYMKLTFRAGNTLTDSNFITITSGKRLTSFTVNKGAPDKADEWLTANGFTLKQERVRYAAERLYILSNKINEEKMRKIETVDASVAYPIYEKCFDMLIADLPCAELFEGALCVRNDNGEAVGVLSLGADRHIGILPEYRDRGLAMRLYAMLAAYEPDLGVQRLFADTDNAASNGLYKKLGFKQDGVRLRCYTLE